MGAIATNGFWLIVPALVWNIVFAGRLAGTRLASDEGVPLILLMVEWMLRVAAFIGPLLLTIRLDGVAGQTGAVLVAAGYVAYFAAWMPHLIDHAHPFSQSLIGAMAPYATPLVIFVGIALLGRSALYGVAAAAFIAAHVSHGLISFQFVGGR